MTFTVTVAPRANPRVKALRGKAKDKFWEAVNRLEHEGCAAGHYRMRAPDGSDAHVCGLRFYAGWRMHQKLVDRINALRPRRRWGRIPRVSIRRQRPSSIALRLP